MSARATIADAIELPEQYNPELAERLRAIKLPGDHGDPNHIPRLAYEWQKINAEVRNGRDERDVIAEWERRHKPKRTGYWWRVWKLKDSRLRAELKRRGWELHKPRDQGFFCHKDFVANPD
jgi:hypothetical protein